MKKISLLILIFVLGFSTSIMAENIGFVDLQESIHELQRNRKGKKGF